MEEWDVTHNKFGKTRFEDLEWDNNFALLKAKYDELLEDLKRTKVDNKTLQNRTLILETEGGAARAENSRI